MTLSTFDISTLIIITITWSAAGLIYMIGDSTPSLDEIEGYSRKAVWLLFGGPILWAVIVGLILAAFVAGPINKLMIWVHNRNNVPRHTINRHPWPRVERTTVMTHGTHSSALEAADRASHASSLNATQRDNLTWLERLPSNLRPSEFELKQAYEHMMNNPLHIKHKAELIKVNTITRTKK